MSSRKLGWLSNALRYGSNWVDCETLFVIVSTGLTVKHPSLSFQVGWVSKTPRYISNSVDCKTPLLSFQIGWLSNTLYYSSNWVNCQTPFVTVPCELPVNALSYRSKWVDSQTPYVNVPSELTVKLIVIVLTGLTVTQPSLSFLISENTEFKKVKSEIVARAGFIIQSNPISDETGTTVMLPFQRLNWLHSVSNICPCCCGVAWRIYNYWQTSLK